MQTSVNKTRGMFKRHINGAPWATEKVQKTFLCEFGEGKIKVLSEEQITTVLKRRVAILTGLILDTNFYSFLLNVELFMTLIGWSRALLFS